MAAHTRAVPEVSAGRKSVSTRRHLARELYLPLPQLISSGGDERLVTRNGLLNAYGCAPFPLGGILELASSTATSISADAFHAAELARLHLINRAGSIGLPDALDERVEEMRGELRALFALEDATDIVFAPSGTDAMMHMAFLASRLFDGPFVNVIAVCDETGSGVPAAIGARHFSGQTALGGLVAKGELVDGVSDAIVQIGVPGRGMNGEPRSAREMDEAIIAAVQAAISTTGHVLLHAMDCSKTGIRAPSLSCLVQISKRWSENVQIVVDACQMRLGRARLRTYLDSKFAVVVTGSKYFTGPPFSGALLIPQALSSRLERIADVPSSGLSAYTTKASWPRAWHGIRAQLPSKHNLGEWVRWEAALSEMTRYFRVPAAFRSRALMEFQRQTRAALQSANGIRALSDDDLESGPDTTIGDNFFCRTIFPFRTVGNEIGPESARQVYLSMNEAIQERASQNFYPDHSNGRAFHIGQPVTVANGSGSTFGALRISASSRIISESWLANDPEGSERRLQEACGGVSDALQRVSSVIGGMR